MNQAFIKWAHRMPPLAAFLLSALLGGAAVAADRSIVAVFDVEAEEAEVPKPILRKLSRILDAQIASCGYQTVPRAEIFGRLRQKQRDSYRQCRDQGCQIELGRELSAQKVLSTRIERIGQRCVVNANLYDLRKAASERAAVSEGGCAAGDLHRQIKQIAGQICEPAARPGKRSGTSAYSREQMSSFAKKLSSMEKKHKRKRDMRRDWDKVRVLARDTQFELEARVRLVESYISKYEKDNPHLAAANRLLDEISPSFLIVASEPAAAEVRVNGMLVGKTPLRTRVTRGSFDVHIAKRKFKPVSRKVAIETGEQERIDVELAALRPPGELVVHSEPVGAAVYLDGELAGNTPLKRHLEPGPHAVRIALDGYDPYQDEVRIASAGRAEVSGRLLRERPLHVFDRWGHISFWSGLGLAVVGAVSTERLVAAQDAYERGSFGKRGAIETWGGVAISTWVAAGALMTTGAILWLVAPSDERWDAEWKRMQGFSAGVAPTDDGGAVLSLSGRF